MKNMFKNLFKWGGVLGVFLLPVLAFAQPTTVSGADCALQQGSIEYALCRISLILNTVVPILIVLGVVYFIYGVISYAIAKDSEAKTSGRDAMIYGLIALLVITSIWGLVYILKSTFGIGDQAAIQVPCIESPGIKCPD